MELKDIASVSGKGGLFKVFKPTRNGVILESLDEKKMKFPATAHHRVSMLHEISIYTTTGEGSVLLDEVLKKIHKEFGDDIGLDSSATPEELRGFLKHLLPDYDEEKVYVSDIKKLVNWYSIILKEAPEILNGEEKEAPVEKKKSPKKTTKKSTGTDEK